MSDSPPGGSAPPAHSSAPPAHSPPGGSAPPAHSPAPPAQEGPRADSVGAPIFSDEPGLAALGGSSAPRRLHPVSPFFDFLLVARQLVVPALLAFNTGGARLLLVGVIVVLGLRVLSWSRRSYALADGVLRVESGLLARSQQLVPAERIQQVNALRKLRHRVLGVVTLVIETAGGGGRIELEVLSEAEAGRLRHALLAAKQAAPDPAVAPGADRDHPDPGSAWVPTPWPVVRLGLGDLALAGITGSSLFVVFAFLGSAVNLVDDLPGGLFDGVEPPTPDVGQPFVLAALVFGALGVLLVTAMAASVLRDFGYDLSIVGNELHLHRGLLDTREAVLPLARIQTVRIDSSWLRRPFGLVSMRITSAGGGAGRDREDGRVAVPVLRRRELDRVLGLVLPEAAPLPTLARPPAAALRRQVVRRVVPAVVLAAVVASFAWPGGLLAILVVPVAAGLGVAAYRGLGSSLRDGILVTRSGALSRRTVVVPTARAQSARLHASPLQRRAGLATLLVDVAGPSGVPRVVDEAAAMAEVLLVATMSGVAGTGARVDR